MHFICETFFKNIKEICKTFHIHHAGIFIAIDKFKTDEYTQVCICACKCTTLYNLIYIQHTLFRAKNQVNIFVCIFYNPQALFNMIEFEVLTKCRVHRFNQTLNYRVYDYVRLN